MRMSDVPKPGDKSEATRELEKKLGSAHEKAIRGLERENRRMQKVAGDPEKHREYEARQLSAQAREAGHLAETGRPKGPEQLLTDVPSRYERPPEESFELRGRKERPLTMKELEREVRKANAAAREEVEQRAGVAEKTKGIEAMPEDHTEALRIEQQRKHYDEYVKGVLSGRIEHRDIGQRYVPEESILSPKYTDKDWNAEQDRFWKHHGNDRQFYERMATKYPALQQELEAGRKIQDLKADPEYREVAGFWYSDSDRLKLVEYEGTNFCDVSGKHRVELAQRHKLGNIPAWVTEARERKG